MTAIKKRGGGKGAAQEWYGDTRAFVVGLEGAGALRGCGGTSNLDGPMRRVRVHDFAQFLFNSLCRVIS